VDRAVVTVDGGEVGRIGAGLLVLVGVAHDDGGPDVDALVRKLLDLRVFPDEEGRMNRSVVEAGGAVLVVSQFTLLADVRRGRRPSFTGAAGPEHAAPLVERVVAAIDAAGVPVDSGRFGAAMEVELVNQGPVTIVIDVRNGAVC
jgi:D-tyrosyl-tRNA(Tyr) deacylase